jgi:hypothetical protein
MVLTLAPKTGRINAQLSGRKALNRGITRAFPAPLARRLEAIMNRIVAIVLVPLFAAACGTPAEVSEGDSALGLSETRSATVTLTGHLRRYGTNQPFAGASICLRDHAEPCTTTGADGNFSFSAELVPGEDVLVVASADGFVTNAFPLTYESGTTLPIGSFLFLQKSVYSQYFQMIAGHPPDPTKGTVLVNVWQSWPAGPALAGGTVAFDPAARVVYTNETGIPDASLSATTVGGRGLAATADISPGELRGTATVAGHTCTSAIGWHARGSETFRVPVLPDAIVSAIAVCP